MVVIYVGPGGARGRGLKVIILREGENPQKGKLSWDVIKKNYPGS